MAHFEATVRVFEVVESDSAAARRAVEERLRSGGFSRWQVVNVALQRAATPAVRVRPRPRRPQMTYTGGGLLVAAIVAWLLWFLYLLT